MTVIVPYHYAIVSTNGSIIGEDRTITFPDADNDGFFANVDRNDANAARTPAS
jgi:hypothetical protein